MEEDRGDGRDISHRRGRAVPLLHPGSITPSSTGDPASNSRDDEVGGGGIIRIFDT
jgi:hypothetical protein